MEQTRIPKISPIWTEQAGPKFLHWQTWRVQNASNAFCLITVYFGIVFDEITYRFRKSLFSKCFRSTLLQKNLKTQRSPASLDFSLKKTRVGKTNGYGVHRRFQRVPFSKCFRAHQKAKLAFANFSDVFGQGLRYWQLRTGVVSLETIESIERFKKFVYGFNELNLHTKRRKRA